MRSFRHLTPRYVWDRLAVMAYERSHPDAPWLTSGMVEILGSWLRSGDVGVEFGSGRSTIWFAKRVAHLVSVEHSAVWYEYVSKQLRLAGLSASVDYQLHEDGETERADSRYVSAIKSIAPASVDFILVDGMARDHCALAGLEKLKSGGALIIDNINWYLPRQPKSRAPKSRAMDDGCATPVWAEVARELEQWRGIWTTNGVCDSALWIKP